MDLSTEIRAAEVSRVVRRAEEEKGPGRTNQEEDQVQQVERSLLERSCHPVRVDGRTMSRKRTKGARVKGRRGVDRDQTMSSRASLCPMHSRSSHLLRGRFVKERTLEITRRWSAWYIYVSFAGVVSLQVLEHLLLHDVRRLLAREEGVAKILGSVVVPDALVDPVELDEVLGLDVENAEVLLESLRVGRLGDDAEIVVDSPGQDDLSRGLAVLCRG